ncbi:MAG TPA: hypothetical protein PLQ52_06300 [Lacunisphaera sp.]|nr:hypothetical protein [Lacunisphaera sp.]HQY05656.1 hypothetical protein [Lacunisphaera sp.]
MSDATEVPLQPAGGLVEIIVQDRVGGPASVKSVLLAARKITPALRGETAQDDAGHHEGDADSQQGFVIGEMHEKPSGLTRTFLATDCTDENGWKTNQPFLREDVEEAEIPVSLVGHSLADG